MHKGRLGHRAASSQFGADEVLVANFAVGRFPRERAGGLEKFQSELALQPRDMADKNHPESIDCNHHLDAKCVECRSFLRTHYVA